MDDDLAYDIGKGLVDFVQEAFGINGANRVGGNATGSWGTTTSDMTLIEPYYEYVWNGVYNDLTLVDGVYFTDAGMISCTRGLATPDDIGHEYGHAVLCFRPSGLMSYTSQAGALEESWADCFGEAFQQFYTGSTDWQDADDWPFLERRGRGIAFPGRSVPIPRGDATGSLRVDVLHHRR